MPKHKSSMSDCVVSLSKHSSAKPCLESQRIGRIDLRRGASVGKQRPVGVVASQALRADSRVGQDNLEWVLLLDDDPINTRGLSRWVKQTLGLETRAARTIQQAERWLASMPAPRAIISDFDLEGSDTAVTALGRFRALGVEVKALVLTGAPVRARAALLDAGLAKTPVLSKANFQTGLAQWLADASKSQSRSA